MCENPNCKCENCTCAPCTCNGTDCGCQMKINELVGEEATAGGTNAGSIATIASVPGAKRKVKKTGKYGAPKAPQATKADGTAKNALDMKANVMGGKAIKR